MLGETIFTPNNIDDSESIITILENDKEYFRDTIISTTQEILSKDDDIKNTIKKQIILLFNDDKCKEEIKKL